jgi:hypothetical protein
MIAKSFAYIAIIAMIGVAMFVFIMDVLKYFCGIDPVDSERQKLQSKKLKNKHVKKKKPVIIKRFLYVNAPPTKSSEKTISTTEETSI